MISKSTITFLKELEQNNNRDWFLSNSLAYKEAKQNYTEFIQSVINKLSKKYKIYADLEANKCLFRINRDVRFSQNKAPYKTNFGASINIYGKKSPKAGLYVHIEPGKSFAGGGIYMPPSDILYKVRQEIDYNFKEFKSVIGNKAFIKNYGQLDMSDALKNPPRGFEKENQAIEFLKLKSFVAFQNFSDKKVVGADFSENLSESLLALQPFIDFINSGLND
jgi:uncharacterized protein (TIGR02453 family)